MTRAVLALALARWATGCATVYGEGTQAIAVTSARPGATVLVDGQPVATTPTTVVVRVTVPAEIAIVAADGRTFRCSTRTTVRGDLIVLQSLLVPLMVGLFVDAWTGAWNERAPTCEAPW